MEKTVWLGLIIFLVAFAGVASAETGHGNSDIRKVMNIANQTYETNMKQLEMKQQLQMQMIFSNLKIKSKDDPQGYLSMAYMAMMTQGADKKAQAAMAAWSVQKYPDSLCLLNNLGYALFLLKDYQNSITIYQQALAIDNISVETITNLGNDYLDADQDDQAKATYERALKIDKDYNRAWEGLFCYYMKKKDIKHAMDIAAKHHPGGFMAQGQDALQEIVDAESPADKCDWVLDGDDLETMEQKVDKIAASKPLNLAPVVQEIDPGMAQEIEEATENLPETVQSPDDPWPIDYSDAEQYYITSEAYADVDPMPDAITDPYANNPGSQQQQQQAEQNAQQYADMSQNQIDQITQGDEQSANDLLNKLKADANNPMAIAQDMKALKDMINSFSPLSNNGNQQSSPSSPSPSSSPATITGPGVVGLTKDTPGMVTTSNFNNYDKNKFNYIKYYQKIQSEFSKHSEELGQRFEIDMAALLQKQEEERKKAEDHGQDLQKLSKKQVRERNNLRDKYVQEFGAYLESFYNSHVKPALEKVENSDALYIRNMNNKSLKNSEGAMMKDQVNALLLSFTKAKAPVDAYEPESTEAARQIQAKITAVKANAPQAGQPLPKLKNFEDQQKSLLEKIVEDTKFSSQVGLAKVTYENAELSVEFNDPVISNQYLTLGVGIKGGDLSASLTQGEGSEFGFKIAKGEGDSSWSGYSASLGVSNQSPGQKTTLYFDDSLNVVDAQVTSTPGSTGVNAGVTGPGNIGVKGSIKVSATAEGESSFESSVKVTYKNWTVMEDKYKQELGQ